MSKSTMLENRAFRNGANWNEIKVIFFSYFWLFVFSTRSRIHLVAFEWKSLKIRRLYIKALSKIDNYPIKADVEF